MSLPNATNPLLLTAAAAGYLVSRSLKFDAADASYLSRSIGAPTDGTKCTCSMWLKRTSSSSGRNIWGGIYLNTDDTLRYQHVGSQYFGSTTVISGVTPWRHLTVSFDTGNATVSQRIRMWLGGTSVTNALSPAQSWAVRLNSSTAPNNIGANPGWFGDSRDYWDGLMAEIHFVDGQSLTASSFAELNASSQWRPKEYAGSYGANGFKLNFSNNSAATAAALGADTSGNVNNWTPNNFNVALDSLTDTPTNPL